MSLGVSAWWKEVWSWDRVKQAISTLPGRLGFEKDRELRFFRLRVDVESGEVYDEILARFLSERERYGLYFILYRYSQTDKEIEEIGEYVTLSQICPALHCPMVKQNMNAFEKVFGYKQGLLYKAAEAFGYEKIDIGDEAVKIYILPKVPIVISVWLGEEEIPPSVSILYDKSVTHYLDCEASSIMAGVTLTRLIISSVKNLNVYVQGVEYSYRYQCSE
ncbi:MAG: DUF3786 domain-containing protein [Ignisphaera sp.]|uniref:DUF3786 domain-containing protein n=3 Tax=Ignisphaera aggregans TaxID=334771 RepID=A0A832AA18_9CREN